MKNNIPEPKFLSVPDSAKICGVSRNTVYMWVRQGKLGAYQTPGKTNLIRPGDLLKFMESNGMFVPASLIQLAKEDEEMVGGPAAGKAPSAAPTNSICTVLVVDDDPMSRSLAVRALKDISTVYQAETGFEALHLMTTQPDIDIVMLDLRMPGQHGLETLKEIKRTFLQVSVIIVSGFAKEVAEDELDGETVRKIIEKPVTVQALQDAIIEVNETRNATA